MLMAIFDFLKKKKKLNVITINIDGGGRRDALSKIPFYNGLKKDSLFLSNFIIHAPYSIGSMHAQISGMHGNLNGVNGYYKSFSFDKKNVHTLTEYLKEKGYHTEMDWVLEEGVPPQGFDKIRSFGKDETKSIDLAARHSEILTQLKPKQPFFLVLDYNKIVLSLLKSVMKKYDDFSQEYFDNKETNFKEYLRLMNESTGYLDKIIAKLKELGMHDDTIIVIYSDHGCSIGDRLGEKVYGVYLYDYTVRCFAYILAKDLPKGIQVDNVVRSIDMMPTIMEMLGVQEKKGYKPIQGKSILPMLNGKESKDSGRIAYCETGGLGGPTPSPEVHNVRCVRSNDWKLIHNKTNNKYELYDLKNDPGEMSNLHGKNQEIEEWLKTEINKMDEEHQRILKGFGQ
jgi:arylsulfatase A-like enzyme